MDALVSVIIGFWLVLAEMAPYLLLGFAIAGALSVFISQGFVERHLGRRSVGSIIKATLLGIPLPLCSCGVIPVAASLRKHGATRAATTSFLLSTPQTGVDSILVTYSLMGPVFAIFRPLAAFLTGIMGGLAVWLFDRDPEKETAGTQTGCTDSCCSVERSSSAFRRAISHGFITLPQDIGWPLVIGILIAGLITALIPGDFFVRYLGSGWLSMVVMMIAGIPMYVCATASVPIAAALWMKGVSAGAVLVFLMTGPATNAAAIMTIWRILGRRTALIYLAVVGIGALFCGSLIDLIITDSAGMPPSGHIHEEFSIYKQLSALILIAVLIYAGWRSKHPADRPAMTEGYDAMMITLSIEGMNCQHCVESVRKTLLSSPGVRVVDVNLNSGLARIEGNQLDARKLAQLVEQLGFTAITC